MYNSLLQTSDCLNRLIMLGLSPAFELKVCTRIDGRLLISGWFQQGQHVFESKISASHRATETVASHGCRVIVGCIPSAGSRGLAREASSPYKYNWILLGGQNTILLNIWWIHKIYSYQAEEYIDKSTPKNNRVGFEHWTSRARVSSADHYTILTCLRWKVFSTIYQTS